MKGNGKAGEQDKGKGKGFWEGAKGTWGSGKNNSKGHKGSRETHVNNICTNMEKLGERTRKGLHLRGTKQHFHSSDTLHVRL